MYDAIRVVTKKQKQLLRQQLRSKPYVPRHSIFTKACRLFSYQQRYIAWLNNLRKKVKNKGGIINCDVGLGKTAIVLMHGKQFKWNMLYICPTNVVNHIAREIEKHCVNVSFKIETQWPTFINPVDIVIMSYYTVSRLDLQIVNASNWIFNTCVIDEVQEAENKLGVKNVLLNSIQARFFVGLTAAEKIVVLPLCKLVHAKSTFKCVRTFRQPPLFDYERFYLALPAHVLATYEDMKQRIINSSGSTGLQKHHLLKETWKMLSLQKIPAVVHFISTIPKGFKTVIVSNYGTSLRSLSKKLTKTSYLLLDTKTQGQAKREFILDEFQRGTTSYLLASIDIIYLGLNLGFVDVMIKMDVSYAADTLSQLLGRLRRSGQKPTNLKIQKVVDFIIENTCDEKLFDSNQIKIKKM